MATPLVNVKLVVVPKSTPATVGLVAGDKEALAPEKVKLLLPVYATAVFPLASNAVIDILCAAPAVSEALPVIRNLVAAPPTTVTLALVTVAPPVAEAKVNVPVPDVPVKISLLVKLATPLTKSPAPDNLLVPVKPEIAPVKLVVTVTLLALASNVVTVLAQKS
ncbi:hypothetical protein AQAU111925_13245 [Aquirufa aurantiipilula]